jgi:hypothetical protein
MRAPAWAALVLVISVAPRAAAERAVVAQPEEPVERSSPDPHDPSGGALHFGLAHEEPPAT